MNISIVDEDDPPPRFIGFCIGIPGQPHGRKCYDSDLDVIQLERGLGVICDVCQDKLIGAKSWASVDSAEPKKGARGPGIVINHEKHTPKPRLKGEPFRKRAQRSDSVVGAPKRQNARNYPK